MRSKQWIVVMLLMVATLSVTMVRSQSVTGTGYEWHHMSIWDGTYTHPVTGKPAVPSVLDQAELSGWEPRGITARVLPEGTRWEFVFRAPVGVPFQPLPAPTVASPPPPPPQPPPATTATGCPGYPTPPFPGAVCHADGGWRPS